MPNLENAPLPVGEALEPDIAMLEFLATNDRNTRYYRNTLAGIASRFRAALATEKAKPTEPVGWKLVPVEPTEAMKAAGLNVVLRYDDAVDAYRAMLAASPTPPSQEDGK